MTGQSMNERTDESATDIDEVTGTKHWAVSGWPMAAGAQRGQVLSGDRTSWGPSGMSAEAQGPMDYYFLGSWVG